MITITVSAWIDHGKPWVAQIHGTDEQYGLDRTFMDPTEEFQHAGWWNRVYQLPDALYESHEGRMTGRRYWEVKRGSLEEISRMELLRRLGEPAFKPKPESSGPSVAELIGRNAGRLVARLGKRQA